MKERSAKKNEVHCRGFILNSLFNKWYDFYHPIQSAQEIWKALENKYISEKQNIDQFLSMKFFEFQMDDNKSIINQVDEFIVLILRLKDLKVDVFEQLQVVTLITYHLEWL